MIPVSARNPLSEVFGFPIQNVTLDVIRQRTNKLCPFHNKSPKCTKSGIPNPIGVCSVFHRSKPVITCPVRFREGWKIISDAAEFFFGPNAQYDALPEVRLKDKLGRKAGNVDYVLVSYDERGRILDFGSLEVQSVYISGNVKGAFQTYMDDQSPDFDWSNTTSSPSPDYLSSSTKRLLPQMLIKGGIFKQWNKKQAVTVQKAFFDTLPAQESVPPAEADLAWFIYDLELTPDGLRYEIKLVDTVYASYQKSLETFVALEAADINKFTGELQKALNAKIAGKTTNEIPLLDQDREAEESEDNDTV